MTNICNIFLGFIIIKKNWNLLKQLIKRNITARYRGSTLGLVWSFMHPLMMLAVYAFVFGVVFKAKWGISEFEENRAAFALIMFCGMAVFNIFSESINNSATLIIANQNYVKKVVFPLELLPLANVASSLFFSLAWFILLICGSLALLNSLSWTIILFPVTIVPLLFFTAGMSFFIASLGVYLRDIQQIIGLVTQVLFFMTPIFYPLSIVPEKYRWILQANPLSLFVDETRKILLYGQQPDWWLCAGMLCGSFIVFQLGLAWFVKTKKGFADVL